MTMQNNNGLAFDEKVKEGANSEPKSLVWKINEKLSDTLQFYYKRYFLLLFYILYKDNYEEEFVKFLKFNFVIKTDEKPDEYSNAVSIFVNDAANRTMKCITPFLNHKYKKPVEWENKAELFEHIKVFRNSVDGNLQTQTQKVAAEINSEKNRFVYELLQNADDCSYGNEKTPEVTITVCENNENNNKLRFEIAYNEVGMNTMDLLSIMTVGESSKIYSGNENDTAEKPIGEKGLGFKSIFHYTNTVNIASGGFCFKMGSFGENYTWKVEWDDTNKSDGTKISFDFETENKEKIIKEIKTLFEGDSFKNGILFLRKIKKINLNLLGETIEIEKNIEDWSKLKENEEDYIIKMTITNQSYFGIERKIVFSKDEWESRYPNVEYNESRGYKISVISPLKLTNSPKGRLYSFLPTETTISAPIIINAPFVLNLNRETVFYDNKNKEHTKLWRNRILSELFGENGLVKLFYEHFSTTKNTYKYLPTDYYDIFHSTETATEEKDKLNKEVCEKIDSNCENDDIFSNYFADMKIFPLFNEDKDGKNGVSLNNAFLMEEKYYEYSNFIGCFEKAIKENNKELLEKKLLVGSIYEDNRLPDGVQNLKEKLKNKNKEGFYLCFDKELDYAEVVNKVMETCNNKDEFANKYREHLINKYTNNKNDKNDKEKKALLNSIMNMNIFPCIKQIGEKEEIGYSKLSGNLWIEQDKENKRISRSVINVMDNDNFNKCTDFFEYCINNDEDSGITHDKILTNLFKLKNTEVQILEDLYFGGKLNDNSCDWDGGHEQSLEKKENTNNG